MDFSNIMRREREPVLDGLRGVAIFLVMAFHLWTPDPVFEIDSWWRRLMSFGWIGVDLFFVVSGFLITRILLSERDHKHRIRNFYARRALRIFPPYFLFCILALVVLPAVSESFSNFLEQKEISKFPYFFFATNFYLAHAGQWISLQVDHLWSLAIEEQYYLVWPFVVGLFTARNLKHFCVFLMLFSFCARLAVWWTGAAPIAAFVLPFCRMEGLALGSWLAVKAIRKEPLPRFFQNTHLAYSVLSGLYVASVAGWDQSHPFMFTVGLSVLTLALGIIVASPHLEIFKHPRVISFGKYSYFIYLFHSLIALFVKEFWVRVFAGNPTFVSGFWAQMVFFLVVVGLCFGLGHLSFRFFETPLLSLKRFFYPPPPAEEVSLLRRTGT